MSAHKATHFKLPDDLRGSIDPPTSETNIFSSSMLQIIKHTQSINIDERYKNRIGSDY